MWARALVCVCVRVVCLCVSVVWAGVKKCRVGAHSVALVLYYFNTDQCTMYCVLYVFLFIYYNTVFFIMVRAAQASPEQPDSQIVGQGQGWRPFFVRVG